MPTARGWLVAVTGACLIVAGVAFGAVPLQQLGGALILLVAVAVVVVRARRHSLDVEREITPQRAPAGQQVEVSLKLTNRGRGAAPLLLLDDRLPLEFPGRARFSLPGLEAGGERRTAFPLRAPRRGRFEIGPVSISVIDPFALARLTSECARTSSFLAYPRIEPLSLPHEGGHQRSAAVSSLRQLSVARGEDFYTLREYNEGDDLRKIHWPSTAKRQRYMIRQEETPWQTRATIVLDDRAEAHDGFGDSSSFERVVETAASVVSLYHRAGYSYRVAPANHAELAPGRGIDHWHRALELLATISPTRGTSADGASADPLCLRLAALDGSGSGDRTLVVVAGSLEPVVAAALTRCRRSFSEILVVSFPPHRFGSSTTRKRWEGERLTMDAVRLLARSGIRSLVLGPEDALAAAWASFAATNRREATRGV